MKIDANDAAALRPASTRTEPARAAEPQRTAGGAESSPASTADQLRLTPDSMLLMEARESLAAAPEVDAARVAALREQIASGDYQVDPMRVATRMLDFERNF